MHASVRQKLTEFIDNEPDIWISEVADVGSFNINGGVIDILPDVVGFDLLPGRGVDVVLEEPGVIPVEHKERYSYVTAISCFQFCRYPALIVQEIGTLLAPGGSFIVTMCGEQCQQTHSTSGAWGWGDEWRMSKYQFKKHFVAAGLFVNKVVCLKSGHYDMILTGEK